MLRPVASWTAQHGAIAALRCGRARYAAHICGRARNAAHICGRARKELQAIEFGRFGRVPSIQQYKADEYFLDKIGTVFQNPEWKNYMSVGLTVTVFAMGDEVAKIVVNQGPVQDLLIVISSRLADPTSGMTKGLTGHCGAGTFGASEIPDPNNIPFLVDPKDFLFSWKHATLGQEAPKESCTSTRVDEDTFACAVWFNDHQSRGNFLEHSANRLKRTAGFRNAKSEMHRSFAAP